MYDEKEENRKRIALKRANQTEEEIDYDKIVARKRRRGLKAAQLAKEHLLQNLAAKKGMKILREVGRLKSLIPRPPEALDKRFDRDMYEWHAYQRKSKEHAKVLEANRPDIVTKLNQRN